MRTFLIRTFSGAFYAALIIGSIFAGPVVFGLVMLAFLLLGITEFHQIIKLSGRAPSMILLVLSSALIYLTGYLITLGILPTNAVGIAVFVYFLAVIIQFFSNSEKVIEKTGAVLLGISYLTIPLLILNLLYYNDFTFNQSDNYILLGLFFITWLNDTFAYIIGSWLGKHKLAERISPNKTLEGSAGGFIFSIAGAYFLSLVFDQIDRVDWIILAAIIVVFGTFGDLLESVMKRSAGLKESGKLIPGHGGILDRIDSILIAAPFVFIYIYFILN